MASPPFDVRSYHICVSLQTGFLSISLHMAYMTATTPANSYPVCLCPQLKNSLYGGNQARNYLSQSIPSGSTPTLYTTKSASHSAWVFTLLPSTTSIWPCVLQCSPPQGGECSWLFNCCPSHLPSVPCHVFGHPQNFRTGIPPSAIRSREGN